MKKRQILLLALLFLITRSHAQMNIYDGFETPVLSKFWSTDRMIPGAFEVQSAVVRNGHSAAKVSLKAGDVFEAGKNGNLNSERDELREANNLISAENILYQHQFSLFLPDSFPIVPTRLVLAQWKQYCPGGACDDKSPVLALRYVSGRLYITIQTDSLTRVAYQCTDEIRNKWLDFTFQVRFSSADSGQVNAWLNGQQIVHYKGVTCYSPGKGFPEKNHFYFKMGLYRDVMAQPMAIYIDEYSKKVLPDR